MSTFGLLFLLTAGLLVRQVAVGRAVDTPGDFRDLFTSLLSADTQGISEVLSRRGENVGGPDSGSLSGPSTLPGEGTVIGSGNGLALVAHMQELGSKAKGYRLGASGPDYYDCSGLVWQAMRDLKIYTGNRFTTSSFRRVARQFASRVDTPTGGDIVLWPGHHMGVLLNATTMYSARSRSLGIGQSSVTGDASYFGETPEYWRLNA